ncbi:MAG: hypothetical protein QM784_25925 [Polyangiaceae bacterium]
MEPAHSGKSDNSDDKGIVKTKLGEDRKPNLRGTELGNGHHDGARQFQYVVS